MVTTTRPQPFQISSSQGNNRYFAVVLLAIACAAGFTTYWHSQGYFQLPPEFASFPFNLILGGIALIFLVFGVDQLFRFRGYRIDPLKQTIQKVTKNLFGTRYGKIILFSDLETVRIVRETRGTRKDKHTLFTVYVHLKKHDQHQIYISSRYRSARLCAEKIARIIDLDLHDDSSGGKTQIRKPNELDKSIREKLFKQGSYQTSPPIPQLMHANIHAENDTLTIENPKFNVSKLGPMAKAIWILFAIFGIWLAVALYFSSTAFSLFAVFFVGLMLFGLLRTETLILTHDTLLARSGIGLFQLTRQIQLSELEELFLSNATIEETDDSDKLLSSGEINQEVHTALEAIIALGSAIVARSDKTSITFGRILSHPELKYIVYRVENWILR